MSGETHTEWAVRVDGSERIASTHYSEREHAEKGAATWVASAPGRTAEVVRREVTDWTPDPGLTVEEDT